MLKFADNSAKIEIETQKGGQLSSFIFSLKTCITYQQFNKLFEMFVWIKCYPTAILI